MMSQNGVIAPTEEGLACFLNDQCLLLFLWHHLPSSCDHPPAQRFNPSQSGRWLRVLMTEFDQGKVHKNADREFLGFFFPVEIENQATFRTTQVRSHLAPHQVQIEIIYIFSSRKHTSMNQIDDCCTCLPCSVNDTQEHDYRRGFIFWRVVYFPKLQCGNC